MKNATDQNEVDLAELNEEEFQQWLQNKAPRQNLWVESSVFLRIGSQLKLNNTRDRPALRLTITKHPRRGEGYSVTARRRQGSSASTGRVTNALVFQPMPRGSIEPSDFTVTSAFAPPRLT